MKPSQKQQIQQIKNIDNQIKQLEAARKLNNPNVNIDESINKLLEARNLVLGQALQTPSISDKDAEAMLAELEAAEKKPKENAVIQIFKKQAEAKRDAEEKARQAALAKQEKERQAALAKQEKERQAAEAQAQAQRKRVEEAAIQIVSEEGQRLESQLTKSQKNRSRRKLAKENYFKTEKGQQELAAAKNLKDMAEAEAKYNKEQQQKEEMRKEEIIKKVNTLKEALKPEIEYCGPAKEDPNGNYTIAYKVLGIKDPNFIQKADASIILKNAYDDKIKVCDTGKSKYNKNDYKTNIEKAYALLKDRLEKDRLAKEEAIRDASIQQKIREEEEAIKNANRAIDEKKAAKKKMLDQIKAEIDRAEKNVKRIQEEEASKKAAEALKGVTAAKGQSGKNIQISQKNGQQPEKNSPNQSNEIELSNFKSPQNQVNPSNLAQQQQQLPIQGAYTCENEPPSQVGIDSPNYNNCYLNALFQMLFQMCYFRRAILDNRQQLNFSPAIEELANIFYRYQQLYDQNQYELLFLTDGDYRNIKEATLERPLDDIQQDPMDILISKENAFFNGTDDIASRVIYHNPFNLVSEYVYILEDQNNADITLQNLTQPQAQAQNFFYGVEPNTDKKYIILNYPRFKIDNDVLTKKQNSVLADPTINIKGVDFVLKGIIVHLGENTDSGHYIYVTYKNDGQEIDKIYDNSLVTDFNSEQTATPDSQQQGQILQERVEQFNNLMETFINTFDNDQQNQQRLREIQIDVITNNYLLGFREKTLDDEFESFKAFFNANDPRANANFFIRAENTINYNNFQETVNRNGTIFLYETISSRVGGPSGTGGPPVTPSRPPPGGPPTGAPLLQPSITPEEKRQLQEATKAAMRLFKIPFNKTFFQIITAEELTNKKNKLLKEIENNVTKSPTELIDIVKFAYKYLIEILYKIGGKITAKFNHLPLERLDSFYTTLNKIDKNYLIIQSNKFLPAYKQLTYRKSIIIQTPKLNGTRKNAREKICNELGQLNPLLNSQRGIPSILRKLTRKITREEIYKPIKARIIKKEAETKNAAEKKAKQTIEKIDAAEKDLKELQTQKIISRINFLSQEIADLRANPAEARQSDINKKLSELRELKNQLELEQQPLKKGSKGGTNKIIRITQQNKKTRKLN